MGQTGEREVIRYLLVALIFAPRALWAGLIAYTYTSSLGGGIALVEVEEAAGKFRDHRVLLVDADLDKPMKVRFTASGKRVVMTNESESRPLLISSTLACGDVHRIVLPEKPDEARTFGEKIIATCGDYVIVADAVSGVIERRMYSESDMSPGGKSPEDIFVLSSGNEALVSFQKDSKKGKNLGNRLGLFALPELKQTADIAIPRDRPSLHIDGNPKEQGPGPEIVLIAESADTGLVTLDLYGAVGLFDWSGVREGKLNGYATLSTALDGSWGNSFPDRACLFEREGKAWALVCNAGEAGGTVLIDLGGRTILQSWATPPGLEHPEYLKSVDRAVTVCSGKIKSRGEGGTDKARQPGNEVFILPAPGSGADLIRMDGGGTVYQFASVHKDRSPLIVAALESDAGLEMILVDVQKATIVDRSPSKGRIQKMESNPTADP